MTLHIKFLAHGQKTSKQTNKKPVAQIRQKAFEQVT